MIKKACYIDEEGKFRWDEEIMTQWYNEAMNQIEKVEPQEITAIPFMVFLMGCETALRVQEKGKLQ